MKFNPVVWTIAPATSRWSFLIACVLLLGCHSPIANSKNEKTPGSEPALAQQDPLQVVNFGPGDAPRFGPKRPGSAGKPEEIWDVHWQSARLQILPGGGLTGQMQTVTGELIDKGKVVCTFQATSATADRKQNLLFLLGKVQVFSVERRTTMRCDTLEYDGVPKVAKARGNVTLSGPEGQISGMRELWTTADLRTAATPDLFNQR